MSESPQSSGLRDWLSYLSLICRLAIGGILLYAGLIKIGDPASFITSIGNYRLAPERWVPLVALTLPWIEILCAAGLIAGLATRANGLIATVLMSVFLYGAIYALTNDINIDCGCFGPVRAEAPTNPIDRWTVVRDIVFITGSLGATLLPQSRLSVDHWWAKRRDSGLESAKLTQKTPQLP